MIFKPAHLKSRMHKAMPRRARTRLSDLGHRVAIASEQTRESLVPAPVVFTAASVSRFPEAMGKRHFAGFNT